MRGLVVENNLEIYKDKLIIYPQKSKEPILYQISGVDSITIDQDFNESLKKLLKEASQMCMYPIPQLTNKARRSSLIS